MGGGGVVGTGRRVPVSDRRALCRPTPTPLTPPPIPAISFDPTHTLTHAQAREYVGALPWVTSVALTMDARAPQPLLPDDSRPNGLRQVAHVIAVSSCKGGGWVLYACLLSLKIGCYSGAPGRGILTLRPHGTAQRSAGLHLSPPTNMCACP